MHSKITWHILNKQEFGDQACQREGTRASFVQILPFAEWKLADMCKSRMLQQSVLLQVKEEEQIMFQTQPQLILTYVYERRMEGRLRKSQKYGHTHLTENCHKH